MGCVVGILVGGASSRMGGAPKGLLRLSSGETIMERTVRVVREANLEVVLVGDLDAYDAVAKVPRIADVTGVKGPLAGLLALLDHAAGRDAIALACDMPFITAPLLRRLATEAPDATVLAPRSDDGHKWDPLCARYAASVQPILHHAINNGDRSFQQILKRVQVTELLLSPQERNATTDWDEPSDVTET